MRSARPLIAARGQSTTPPRKNRMRSAGSILAVKAWLQIGQLAELTAHSEGGGAWFIHRHAPSIEQTATSMPSASRDEVNRAGVVTVVKRREWPPCPAEDDHRTAPPARQDARGGTKYESLRKHRAGGLRRRHPGDGPRFRHVDQRRRAARAGHRTPRSRSNQVTTHGFIRISGRRRRSARRLLCKQGVACWSELSHEQHRTAANSIA
jgi:hypothetical protein